jgi:hypothetical protein
MMNSHTRKNTLRYLFVAISLLSIFIVSVTQVIERNKVALVRVQSRDIETPTQGQHDSENAIIDLHQVATRKDDPIQNDKNAQDKKRENKWEPFNSTNPFVDSWCPNAKCFNSPSCTPCNQRYLFIVGTGRAGSTTLLRMFNELPNLRLSGENYNEFRKAAELSTNLFDKGKDDMFHYGEHQDGPFFHHSIPKGSFGCVMQDLLRFMNPPPLSVQKSGTVDSYDSDRILGMKTIRLHTDWSAPKAATFFKQNFPCSKFVVNIRSDVESQLSSYENLRWKDGVDKHDIRKRNRFYKNFAEEMGKDRSTLIDMSKWKDDIGILNNVIHWLGYRDCDFGDIYHENSKESGGYGTDTNREIKVSPQCRLE